MKFRKFFRKYQFEILLGVLLLLLLIERSIPYFLYGPYGFGYDLGIYKKIFEEMNSLAAIREAQISPLPAFIAYLSNLLHLPVGLNLYYFYIFISAFVAVPLYLLAKECFGKEAGLLAVVLFTISYSQVFAAEFYLYKAILGMIFLLYALLYYVRKSNWFYLFAVLLALTQMPQLLVLGFAVLAGAVVDFKKNLRFHLRALLIFLGTLLLLLLVSWQNISDMFKFFWDAVAGTSLSGVFTKKGGLFMPWSVYLRKEILVFVFGLGGVIYARKNDNALPLIGALVFLIALVFNEIFFENRFIIPLSLFIAIFAAHGILRFFSLSFRRNRNKLVGAVILILISMGSIFYYYSVIPPTLNQYEVTALDFIAKRDDAKYVMVVDTYYAPWVHGFSGKETLAPGIFISVWDLPQFGSYIYAARVEKIKMLLNISDTYGKFYLFEGVRQARDDLRSPRIKKVFDIYGARVYEVDSLSLSLSRKASS